jgi:hypothetical protein
MPDDHMMRWWQVTRANAVAPRKRASDNIRQDPRTGQHQLDARVCKQGKSEEQRRSQRTYCRSGEMSDESDDGDKRTKTEHYTKRYDKRPIPVQSENRRIEKLNQRVQTEEDQYDR